MRIGLDIDGIIRDSIGNEMFCMNETFKPHNIPPITIEQIQEHFTSDWHTYYRGLGAPEHLHDHLIAVFKESIHTYGAADLVPNAHEFLERLAQLGTIIPITNASPILLQMFFTEHKINTNLLAPSNSTPGKKYETMQAAKIDVYVGDTVSDGVACITASNKPQFIGVAHKYGYNTYVRLIEFKDTHNHPITIVESLDEALVKVKALKEEYE